MAKALNVFLLQQNEAGIPRLLEELRHGDYEPDYLCTYSVAHAIELIGSQNWDLILSDYQLDDGTVLELLGHIRQSQLDIPMIVLSTRIDEDVVVQSMRAGAHDVIVKSNLQRLVPAVERELCENAVHRAHRQALVELRESEERFRQLAENIHQVFWLMDYQTSRFIYLSPSFEDIWESGNRSVLEHPTSLLNTVHPEDFSRIEAHFQENGWAGFNADYRIVLPDGQERWISTRSYPIKNSAGEVYRIASFSRDITEYRHLLSTAHNLARALEQSADGVMIADCDGHIVYVNSAFEQMSGYRRDELLGKSPKILNSGWHEGHFYKELWGNLLSGLPFTDVFINRRKDGELYYEEQTITPVRDDNGDITHFISTAKDITSRLQTQERLHRVLHFDTVTGLATRLLLVERLEQAISHARRFGGMVGVMCVGLDYRMLVDEMRDHALEERILQVIAQRLRECVDEHATLARSGENEFMLISRCALDNGEIEAIAGQLLNVLAMPITAGGYQLYLSPVIGVSLYPGDGDSALALIEAAREALQQASEQGKPAFAFHKARSTKGRRAAQV